MKKDISIRKPEVKDTQGYLELINSIIEEGEFTALEKPLSQKAEAAWLKKMILLDQEKEVIIFCADFSNELAGHIVITKGNGANKHLGTLGVIVGPKYRKLGIGRTLIEAATKLARKDLKVDKIILQVREGNLGAENFYLKLGFAPYGKLPKGLNIKGNYYDTIFMYKDIK
jgi:RimJ/RimL family protein N-acetyltransferase